MKQPILWTLCAALALAAYGCGSDSGVGAAGADTQPGEPSQQAPQTASVTFRTQFPGQGQATKTLLDPSTTRIWIEYYGMDEGTSSGDLELTPENETASIILAPGRYEFFASAMNANELTIERVSTSGRLVAGLNTVILTFLGGSWTFVDANGEPAPLELSAGAGSLLLDGFELSGFGQGAYGTAAAASMSESQDYSFRWGGRVPSSPWNDNDPQPFSHLGRQSMLWHGASFTGGPGASANKSFLEGGDFNLTKGCGESYGPYYVNCVEEPGDRLIFILGGEMGSDPYDAALPPEDFSVDVSPYVTSTVTNGNTITGNLGEILIKDRDLSIGRPAAAAAKAAAVRPTTRDDALRRTVLGAAKAAQSENTFLADLTHTSSEYVILCESEDHGDWSLYDQIDVDGDGTLDDAWGEGWLYGPNLGSCSNGLSLAAEGDPGEWEDWNGNGMVEPQEFEDRNNDGTFDLGDIELAHWLNRTEILDVTIYPFVAKGTPGTKAVYAIRNAFVQYRTHGDETPNRYQGWVDLGWSGVPIQPGAIASVTLLGPVGAEGAQAEVVPVNVPVTTSGFHTSTFFVAGWDSAAGSFGPLSRRNQSGFSLNLSNYNETGLPAGDYTYQVETIAGDSLTGTLNFPGRTDLPIVDSNTMVAAWASTDSVWENNSLTFSWQAPTGAFGEYRLVVYGRDWGGYETELFYGTVPNNVTSVTIPGALAQKIAAPGYPYYDDWESVQWRLQTRNNTADGKNNYARGISGSVRIPRPDEAVGEVIVQ